MSNITIEEFVSREVIYCVSSLVSTLITAAGETGSVGDISQDELYSLCQRDDYETPARENGWTMDGDGTIIKYGVNEDEEIAETDSEIADSWQDACEIDRLDPETVEVYEHWIVTDYLASKLEAKGEIVAHDIAGLTIWGRCTTGQRISMDGVIESIYNEMIGA